MKPRKIISVEVTEEAKARIDEVSEATGVDMKRIASRMYEWFAEQDDLLQKGILGILPKGLEPDLARAALERIVRDGEAAKADGGLKLRKAAHEPRKSPGTKA
jgi:hypothetical protein